MTKIEGADPEALLQKTPYLIGDGPLTLSRFGRVSSKALSIRDRALAAAALIADRASMVLPQFEIAVRSDLVAESNRMEGIPSLPRDVRALAALKHDLLSADVGAFLSFVRDDSRLLEALPLYKAYQIADDWARSALRPREFELRGLHELVLPSLPSAGAYKADQNEIGGSSHVPTPPWDVQREMGDLASWFATGTGDAVLDAAVVHAWITHIHPFDDGNGRMARLLANLALIQSNYPPLLLRSRADRGQYLDALNASDEGDILPLYDLFVQTLRRLVKTMEHPNYVQGKINGDLLATSGQRHEAWLGQATAFFGCIQQKVKTTPWTVQEMGYPTAEHFDLLQASDPAGNCWFFKLFDDSSSRWLLWFGYQSEDLRDLLGARRRWPSVYFSRRTVDPDSVHPYEWCPDAEDSRPSEISFAPGEVKPVTVRWGFRTESMQVDEAAAIVVRALVR